MKKSQSFLAYIILAATIIFNLYLYYPETQILADPNDNIFQYSLVARTNWIWQNYGCPLSLFCLPNLVDHNVPAWAEGYPLPFYYSHIPQIAVVASYHLVIQPLNFLLTTYHQPLTTISLYQYYNLTKYLLLSFFPLSVFFALRIVGFSPLLSAIASFFGNHFSTDGLYGIDSSSFLWRGYGLISQLYAMIFMPLAIAFTYRSLSLLPSFSLKSLKLLIFPSLFLILTTAGHLGMGMITILSTLPFLFFDFQLKNILQRGKILLFVFFSLFFVLSYWLIPIFLNNNYHIISFWDPIWKFNSYGWFEVIRQFFQGEIFDWGRPQIITSFVIVGFFATLVNRYLFPFALLFAMWFLFYFGRTTWGGVIDLIPGMKDFHQHRFIVGIHIASLFLLPAALDYLSSLLNRICSIVSKLKTQMSKPQFKNQTIINKTLNLIACDTNRSFVFYLLSFIFISSLAYFTAIKTIDYALLNNQWIYEANRAYQNEEKNFQDLVEFLKQKPPARVYAGRPGNWGRDFRIGSSQMYMQMGIAGFDVSQFLPETWSMMSENEQNFDERMEKDYDLLNIRYIVADKNHDFTQKARLVQRFGHFELYEVPTTGWFDVVTSPMFVKTDKTNFINLVHFWHRSYPRTWKMHPLISVEKKPKIPSDLKKIIEMTDEVSYKDISFNNPQPTTYHSQLNIFSDFPFVFPEATPSGKILREKVEKQTYSATVSVPPNCNNCMIVFKMSYHPDWQVKIDGKQAEKFAVFPYYLAVQASQGNHSVEFTYKPNLIKTILLYGEVIVLLVGGSFFLIKLLKLLK